MKILLTGAFGRLGAELAEQILQRGHALRAMDLDTPASRKLAAGFKGRCELEFCDLLAVDDFDQRLAGVDGVIHLAAMLPPDTQTKPELAQRLNVDVTRRLIDAISRCDTPPHLVYPSSVSVFARTTDRPRPRHVNDPVEATDNYTQHKLEIEQLLQKKTSPWTILRVGVAVDSRTLSADRDTLSRLLQAAADSPVEWVHPKDVALAMCRALEVPAARRKTLLIGGGANCQVTQGHFMGTAFRAMGLRYPEQVHGNGYFYTHWMDTAEAQSLLQYQEHDFADYETEMSQRLSAARTVLRPMRALVNPLLEPILRRL